MEQYTFLKLHGWTALRCEIDGAVGLFLYNPHHYIIVNQKETLRNESIPDNEFTRMLQAISYSDIPADIISRAVKISENIYN